MVTKFKVQSSLEITSADPERLPLMYSNIISNLSFLKSSLWAFKEE